MATHATTSRHATLKSELMALGADILYRRLTKQLQDLKAAYPAIARKYSEEPPELPPNGANPAPDALRRFQARKATRKAPKPATRHRGQRMKPGETKPGTLAALMVDLLRLEGPMTALALANALYEKGLWKPKTATTIAKRTSAIGVMLRQFVSDNRKLVRIASGKGTAQSPRVYAAY